MDISQQSSNSRTIIIWKRQWAVNGKSSRAPYILPFYNLYVHIAEDIAKLITEFKQNQLF